MKKIVAILLAVLLVAALSACAAPTVKTGMGHVITLSDTSGDNGPATQVNAIFVAASFDKDGKVLSATIDVAQVNSQFDAEGKLTSTPGPQKSKADKGDAYGMKNASGIGKDWYEQAAFLEKYFVGKTVTQILATPTYVRDDHHQATPTEGSDLAAGTTIDIGEFLEALALAYQNAK